MDKIDMGGRVSIITGAGGGIGRATAVAFARAGARVVVADVKQGIADETVDLIRKEGGESIAVTVNVADSASVQAMVAKTVATYGGLDCAINNAGVHSARTDLHEITEEEWHRVTSVNLTGVFLCMKYEIPHMLAKGKGSIVNTASVSGLTGSFVIPYGASKHGVVGLTKSAARQYSARGIRINAVCPGGTDTPMTAPIPRENRTVGPLGRTAQPEELAAAFLWLCSDSASYVMGHAMPVDGGWMAR